MRVCAVVPLYPPRSRVGAWLSTHECLRGLVDAGHDVTVVAHMASHGAYVHDGIHVVAGNRHIATIASDADVVVIHAGDRHRIYETVHDQGTPTVVMVHGELDAATQTRFARRPPALTIANAQATAATVGWPGRIEVVHPPVWPHEHAIDPGGRVAQVNLSPEKGGKLFWQLARRCPRLPFLGVYGGYGDQITSWWFNVKTTYGISDMRHVWSQTRVLLMPSEKETWGRVGIEAMCAGIPVIAHPTEGLQESLGDAGTFVDRDDIDGWEQAICELQDPQRWQQASIKALQRAYSLDPVADVARFTHCVIALVASR